ncbi:MAG: 2-hydroxyglutaryl-CoA dehydratase [Tissierellia bacterium]|nr:2-hydroxyglutaryl-CoA dehydratase [Tissierellia bacterium]
MTKRIKKIEFTKEMKKDYTILCPDMAPIHFALLERVFRNFGYNMKVLKNKGQSVVDEGLKNVHNDTCYPALLVIGQMIDALNSGNYDLDKVALMITQTGGGCRASNYIHLLRKALQKSGYGNIPVISLNAGGMEKNSGFRVSLSMLKQAMAIIFYGDLLMLLNNQVKPYEITEGQSEDLVERWIKNIVDEFNNKRGTNKKDIENTMIQIVKSFEAIPRKDEKKIKVGIVGEIYVKFSSLGNNDLEDFLFEENCEVMVPGLMGFLMYCVENGVIDFNLYGKGFWKSLIMRKANDYLSSIEEAMSNAIKNYSNFTAPSPFKHLKDLVDDVIGVGCKMGEGWLLPAEMMELIGAGFQNIVVTQPFGCLPNHIVGKGIVPNIKKIYPFANIVLIDYDPGATRVNQENRIKLMLSLAKERLEETININKEKESLKEELVFSSKK